MKYYFIQKMLKIKKQCCDLCKIIDFLSQNINFLLTYEDLSVRV
ncbi:hypothetical protein CLOL250_01293 [Clostridium sp. L2-50]|nr:hypothetical protein CLOL250_01293 [Clostridium sp. L2-50]